MTKFYQGLLGALSSILFTVLVVVLVYFGVKYSDGKAARVEESMRPQRLQEHADAVVGEIEYIKDPRTGICFAYYWSDNARAPSLTAVPSEAIPCELLTVAKVGK